MRLTDRPSVVAESARMRAPRGISSSVERELPKLERRVRFPYPALAEAPASTGLSSFSGPAGSADGCGRIALQCNMIFRSERRRPIARRGHRPRRHTRCCRARRCSRACCCAPARPRSRAPRPALLAGSTTGPRRITELADTQVARAADRHPARRPPAAARPRRAASARRGRPRRARLAVATRAAPSSRPCAPTTARVLRAAPAELPDDEVTALVAATETLGHLIDALQERREP